MGTQGNLGKIEKARPLRVACRTCAGRSSIG